MAQAAMPAMALPRRVPMLGPRCAGSRSLSGGLAGGGSDCGGHQVSSNRVETVRSSERGDRDGEDHHDHALRGGKTVVLRAVEGLVDGVRQVRGAQCSRR